MNESVDVIILDAEARSSLACIRALGSYGLNILAASPNKNAIGFSSKYLNKFEICPDPSSSKSLFEYWLISLIKEKQPKLLIPCSDLTLEITSENRKVIEKITTLAFPNSETLSKILKKENLLELANSIGINTPQTIKIPSEKERSEENIKQIKQASFPAVIKPSSSFSVNSKGEFDKHSVYYPKDYNEAVSIIDKINAPLLLQQQILGEGIGVFALCVDGVVKNLFCHKRLLEKPPTGGRSVLSQSIRPEDAPVEDALKLLKELNWQGPAMVEFKKHTDDKHYLMEINPRFWGSLQLSISSGVNFPVALYKIFVENDPKALTSYQDKPQYKGDIRLRWCHGTLDHLFISAKKDFLNTMLKVSLRNALLFWKAKTFHDVFQLKDIRPFLQEFANYFRKSE